MIIMVRFKVLLDQTIFSPVNLKVYFATLGLCEMFSFSQVKSEIIKEALENIYKVMVNMATSQF